MKRFSLSYKHFQLQIHLIPHNITQIKIQKSLRYTNKMLTLSQMINIFGQRKTITTKTKMKVVKQNSTKKMVKNFFINNSFSFSDTTIGCSWDSSAYPICYFIISSHAKLEKYLFPIFFNSTRMLLFVTETFSTLINGNLKRKKGLNGIAKSFMQDLHLQYRFSNRLS